MIKTNCILSFIIVLFTYSGLAQSFNSYSKIEKDSIKNINYIEKDYQFLSNDFKIDLNDENEKQISDLKLQPNFKYKDSLRAILKYNLKSDYAVHLAYHRILKKWENTGFYIWMSPEDSEKLANSLNIYHPHLFYEYLVSEKEDAQKASLFSNLKQTLQKELKVENPEFDTNKALLKYAFKLNPEREIAMKAYFKKLNDKHKK
jgi:hypothetical protein